MEDFVDEYVEVLRKKTDAPPIYIEASAYLILSATLGPYSQFIASYNPEPIIPNIWELLLGPSRIVRKTNIFKYTCKTLEDVLGFFTCISDGSPEGFVTVLSKLNPGDLAAFLRDEMGGWFRGIHKKDYMGGLRELMNSIYDGVGFNRVLRSQTFTIPKGLYFIVFGTVPTPIKLYQCFNDEDFASGFLNRFLLVYVEEREIRYPITYRNDEADDKYRKLIEELKTVRKGLRDVKIVSPSGTVAERMDKIDVEVEGRVKAEKNSFFGTYLSTYLNHLLKLSILHRLGRGGLDKNLIIIEDVDLEHSKRFLDKVYGGAEKLIKEDFESRTYVPYEFTIDRVKACIDDCGGAGISWSELWSKRFRWRKKELLEALERLHTSEDIKIFYGSSGRGRRKIYFVSSKYNPELKGDFKEIDFQTFSTYVKTP